MPGGPNPIKFCVYPYGLPLRLSLLEHHRLQQLIDISQCVDVFPDPSTYPCILIVCAREGSPSHRVKLAKADSPSSARILHELERSSSKFAESRAGDLLGETDSIISIEGASSIEATLLKKIAHGRPVIGDFFAIEQAIRIGSKQARQEVLLDRHTYENLPVKNRDKCYPVLDGSDIRRYQINWPDRWLLYDPSLLYNAKTPEIMLRAKTLVKRVGERLSAVYEEKIEGSHAHPLNTIYIVHPLKNRRPNDLLVTLLLNSVVSDWWYRTKYQAICVRGGYVEFRENLKYLPLPQAVVEATEETVVSLPTFVMSEADASSDTSSSLVGAALEVATTLKRISKCVNECLAMLDALLETNPKTGGVDQWTGSSKLRDLDYLGWERRFPNWRPDDATAADAAPRKGASLFCQIAKTVCTECVVQIPPYGTEKR